MATDRKDDLRRWLDTLHVSSALNPLHRDLYSAAVQLLDVINRCAPSEYREMALCKLADIVPLGYIAARPTNQGDSP